ncbi:hypothetical protein D3C73_1650410 [compost metagenome]
MPQPTAPLNSRFAFIRESPDAIRIRLRINQSEVSDIPDMSTPPINRSGYVSMASNAMVAPVE